MSDDKRILITFDEFFKHSSKSFFEKEGFKVETEVEIFHLPKRLDVLVVKNSKTHLPDDFTLLHFWKENNLISFKSKPDSLEIYDIWDSVLYLFGFINRNKTANLDNTTMSLLVNNHPREFLKKYKRYCTLLEKGVWVLDFNFARIILVELHKIGLKGLDRLFLGNFSIDSVFLKVLEEVDTSSKDSSKSKRIDIIKNIIYHRIAGFEKDPEIRRKYMATVYEADITDLVKPHLENAKREGKLEGKLEGRLEGKLEGKQEKALETALKMRDKGFSILEILEITGLNEIELKEKNII